MPQQSQSVQNQDPEPDRNDWAAWIQWQNAKLANKVSEDTERRVMGRFQSMIETAQEQAWQQKHPNVDISVVKGFAQMRGIRELDDAMALMEMQTNVQQVARQTAQQAFNSFRQPQTLAQPLRGTQSAPAPAQLRYDTLAKEFQESNGTVYNSWSPEIRAMFDRESNLREAQRAAGARQR